MGDGREKLRRFLDCHVEHVGDVLPFIPDVQGLLVKPRAMANVAEDIHVRKEIHLDGDRAVALTMLAPPPLHVEGKAPGFIAAGLRLGQAREQVADTVKDADVSHGIRARGSADRALVDVDYLIDILKPGNFRVIAFRPGGAHGAIRDRGIQNIREQG